MNISFPLVCRRLVSPTRINNADAMPIDSRTIVERNSTKFLTVCDLTTRFRCVR